MTRPGSLPLLLGLAPSLAMLASCAAQKRGSYAPGTALRGEASYYGRGFHGRKTASGEKFDMHALTAAHRTLPMGTRVRVTNLNNGRTVVVRINDRGPFHKRRIIDVSYAAAHKLDMLRSGVVPVKLEILKR